MASKKNPSIFSTLQKTTANASAVNGEFTHQIPLDALEDNPLNRFSMAEDEEFLSTMHSMHHQRSPARPRLPKAGPRHRALQDPPLRQ